MLSSDSTSLQLHSQSKILVPYQQFLIHIRKKRNIFEISLLSPRSDYWNQLSFSQYQFGTFSDIYFIWILINFSVSRDLSPGFDNFTCQGKIKRVSYHVLRSSSFQSLSLSAVFSSISCKFHGARSPVSKDFYQSTFRSVRSETASCMPSYCYSETTWEDQVWFKIQGKVYF